MNESEVILKVVAEQVKTCTKCPLYVTKINAVPGTGSPYAKIMFIGEGPGANEDAQGLPFVGAAGQLLDKLLEMIGLARADVFITNIVKCRPPQNRTPQENEITICKPYLQAQIATINPEIIITLGTPATQTMLGRTVSMSGIHGRIQLKEGFKFFPMYHPAAYLHKRDPQLLEDMKKDFRDLQKMIQQK